jgi:hypothetical protein
VLGSGAGAGAGAKGRKKGSGGGGEGLSLLSRMHSLDGLRVAGEKDFDGQTGEIKITKSRSGGALADSLVVLDATSTADVMAWLTGIKPILLY